MKIIKKLIISSLFVSIILVFLVSYYVFFWEERLPDSGQDFLFYITKNDIHSQIQGTEALDISFVIPTKKIFYTDELIQGYVVSLSKQNNKGKLEIIKNKAIIHERNILLDQWGLSLFDLPNFGKGFYRLNLKINEEQIASNNFFVADRSPSHLSTVILNTYLFDDLLTVWGLVYYKGIPFQRKLKAEILSRSIGFEGYLKAVSDIDDFNIVKTIDLEVVNGNFTLKSLLPEWRHTSPYFIRIRYEDKEKCISPLFLPKSINALFYPSEEIDISRMGKRYVASYSSIPTEKSFYGFSIKRGEETFDSPWGFEYTASPWELEYPKGEKIRINALKPLRIAAVFILNPVTLELRTFISEKPKSLKIIPDDPYSLLYIYSNSKSLEYLDKAILFKDKEIKANLSVQGKFKAGEDLPIEIKARRTSKCILIISDAQAGREGLNDLLGSEIFSHLREDRDAFSVSKKLLIPLRRITEPTIFSSLPPPPPSFPRRYRPLKEKNIQPLPESFKTQKAADIVLFDSFEVRGRVKKMVKMPDKPGIWKAELIVFYGDQYSFDRIEKIFKTY